MRLFIETQGQIGDTLMQTPALRALPQGVELMIVTTEGSLAHQTLSNHPRVTAFMAPERARAVRRPEDRWLKPSAWDALQWGIRHHRPMVEGFAAQIGVSIQDYAYDLVLSDEERRTGRELLKSVGKPYKTIVCARHSTNCRSATRPGSSPNKCFSNAVWNQTAEWLIGLGYVPLAVGAASEAEAPGFETWPGPRLYDQPLRTIAALIAASRAVFCIDTGLRHVAAAVGADLACVSGEIPTWLIFAPPARPDQRIVERLIPPSQVTFNVCKELLWPLI